MPEEKTRMGKSNKKQHVSASTGGADSTKLQAVPVNRRYTGSYVLELDYVVPL